MGKQFNETVLEKLLLFNCWKLSPTLCYPMDCSRPGSSALHYLPEFTQIHAHWVGDAIQPSHPQLTPSPFAFNLSQHQNLFQQAGSSHSGAKVLVLQLQHQSSNKYSELISFRIYLVWSPSSPGHSLESSPATQFESISSSMFSLLYGPTHTTIHDYWKNHSLD